MEEIRIDCAHPTEEEMELSRFHALTLFHLNHTMPFTEEYDLLINQLFPEIGENSRIVTPLKGVRFNKVSIGKNVVINSDCLMMAAGGKNLLFDNPLMLCTIFSLPAGWRSNDLFNQGLCIASSIVNPVVQ